MKKWMCIYVAAVLTVSALAGCGVSVGIATIATRTGVSREEASKAETAKKETTKASGALEKAGDTASEEIQAAAGKHHAKINVKGYGVIPVELHGDEAPITVVNSLRLVKGGFYGGLISHRIIGSFMIQGSDPSGTGMGGSGQEVKGEFSNSGVEDPLSHTRRAISMARSQIKDSASSQFFIMHEDSIFPSGGYACFGYVTEGMEVMDVICEDTKVEDNDGSVVKANQPIIGSIEVMD